MSSHEPLFDALKAGDAEAVARLLASDPACARSRNEQGLGPVLFACHVQRTDLAERVADAAGELDVFEAAAVGRVDRLHELLEADPVLATAWTPDGFTALHFAAWLGRRDAVALLLDSGADIGAVARNGMKVQPLHSAASGRHAPVIALLLARGADANARQHGGITALHAAAHAGDPESVRLLLKAGADASLATDDGKRAMEFARDSKRAELIVPMIEAALRRKEGA